ncbi:hypothetical protein Q0590_15565 [Rhodocytophaga aerolata]|uniref:DUF4350 domain-containing protein n=1 Tax=Rhodocytophaga aerolata TaxID=455078 RepID=A0ABT8R8Z2_9BACT|nr:DUF4350 domain-containing protein [Rhodocytophaga aerolata]MDO1447688.1 hypothetical protein [Rhodocytophaga aerolata]
MKENKKYILLLAAAILLVIVVEWLTPKPINWTATYSQDDKNPFGSFILYDLLPDLFPGKSLRTLNKNLYELDVSEELADGNYIFVSDECTLGEEDSNILLNLATNGNSVFIAAHRFPQYLKDTLVFETENIFFIADSLGLNLEHPQMKSPDAYYLKRVDYYYAFTAPKTKEKKPLFQILGNSKEGKPNFIRIPFGKGYFYLNTLPLAYTNYNMLYRQNASYIANTLSYLPVQNTFWDEYYKINRGDSQTPLRYIISQPPLRWALYLTLIALVLFMIFEAKRKQRIIPIIKPLANTTLEFTETVGRLYFQYKDHRNIAEKKITYFLDYLRSQYYVKTTEFDDELYNKLADKTGHDKQQIITLFELIKNIRSSKNISEEELVTLNRQIENFHKKSI